MEKNETQPFHTPSTKINSKWIKDLNVRQTSIRILQENIGSNHFDISDGNFFPHMSPKAKETKVKMNFRVFIKSKASAQQRKESRKQRGNPPNG